MPKRDKKPAKKKTKKAKFKKKLAKKEVATVHAEAAVVKKDQSKDPADYRIPKAVLEILTREGITELFPIQYQTFDLVYDGMDVVGKAYTGSGKTLAFVLPTIAQLKKKEIKANRGEGCSVICLSPTRELCMQIAKVFATYAVGLSVSSIYGGSSYERQMRELERGADIVVGTCGRVKDLIEQKYLKLDRCQFVILDEADEMLNMGFEEDVEEILGNLNKSEERTIQTMLFSATIPQWINTLIDKYLREERRLVDLVSSEKLHAAPTVDHMALCCHWQDKEEVLADILKTQVKSDDKVMIFCETKKDCNELIVSKWITQECQVLHGDIVQRQREITTMGFRNGRFPILVCTDVAARGLDIKNVQLVIQLEAPGDPLTYVHRSGRSGRAGKKGKSIMFFKPSRTRSLQAIERKIGRKFRRIGAPQSKDIARVCASHTADKMKEVPKSISDVFLPMAKDVMESMDPQTAIANAMAIISGYSEQSVTRSALSASRGYVTLQCTTDVEIKAAGYVYSQIEKFFGYKLRQAVRGMTLRKDRLGAVFDCPEHSVTEVTSLEKPWLKFEVITELPEMEVNGETSFGRGRGRFSGGRGGRFGGRGNRRGRGGFSRGRGRGGFSRGRGRGGFRGGRGRFSNRGSWGRGRSVSFGGRGRGRGVGKGYY